MTANLIAFLACGNIIRMHILTNLYLTNTKAHRIGK